MLTSPIISIQILLEIFQKPDVLLFEASNLPQAKELFENEHLQNSFFIEVNTQLASIKSNVALGGSHPLPLLNDFLNTLQDLGIDDSKQVIVYDRMQGSNAAARFWWMIRAVGHENVQVLDGGFQLAKASNFPLEKGINQPIKTNQSYQTTDWLLPLITLEDLKKGIQSNSYQLIDVRSAERFMGISEPIDLVAGHIPSAINVPFTENLAPDGTLLSSEVLEEKYKNNENTVVYCGSGITACHTLLAFDHAKFPMPTLYVGSWSEWSRREV